MKKISETTQVKFALSAKHWICKSLFGLLCQKRFAYVFIRKRFILLEERFLGKSLHLILQ